AIVTLSALLSTFGGNVHAHPPASGTTGPDMPLTTPTIPAGTEAESADGALPNVEMTDEMLYKLLHAEIAYQRGDWQLAYVTMLAGAQETRDPRLARRAAEIALSVKQAGEALSAVRL